MVYSKDFSIIIPVWRGAIQFLPKMIDSIPDNEGIEIIVVDNSKEPVKSEEIDSTREVSLLHSAPERHAGGSRNDGIAVAKGKWLLFADADDYFSSDAFETFYSKIQSDADIVYTGMGGVYGDTGEPSQRGQVYAERVHKYCIGEADESTLRFNFASPCCKMISHDFVEREKLRFDEIRASNDIYFSLTSGYFATKIEAVDKVTYIATINRGSLTKRRDYEVIKARYYAALRCNLFKREHDLGGYQASIMYYLFESRKFGVSKILEFVKMMILYRQNPFVGCTRWIKSYFHFRKSESQIKEYIVK